jgi:zinc transport system substrate-binding protein
LLITVRESVKQGRVALIAIAVVIPLTMAGVLQTGARTEQQSAPAEKVKTMASFYPLYDFASHVAGDRAEVSSLVPPGIESHDWEPTLGDVTRAREADLLIINGAGFESWAEGIGARVIVNASEGLKLEAHEEEEEHEGEAEDEHGHEGIDPHIWLDPVLAKHQVDVIRAALARADPAGANYYNDNAERFSGELDELDAFIRSELSSCEKSDFIAFHDAFSRFAERYGLVQHSIHGMSPEGELLPQKIEGTIALANELGLDVVYSEDLVDSRLADVIADEIPGGRVLVLSPVEGISSEEADAGIGYIEKMRQNVAALKEGLQCA